MRAPGFLRPHSAFLLGASLLILPAGLMAGDVAMCGGLRIEAVPQLPTRPEGPCDVLAGSGRGMIIRFASKPLLLGGVSDNTSAQALVENPKSSAISAKLGLVFTNPDNQEKYKFIPAKITFQPGATEVQFNFDSDILLFLAARNAKVVQVSLKKNGVFIAKDSAIVDWDFWMHMDVTPSCGLVPFDLQTTVTIRQGKPPYALMLDYGDGQWESISGSQTRLTFSHRYDSLGVWNLSLSVVDDIGGELSYSGQVRSEGPLAAPAVTVELLFHLGEYQARIRVLPSNGCPSFGVVATWDDGTVTGTNGDAQHLLITRMFGPLEPRHRFCELLLRDAYTYQTATAQVEFDLPAVDGLPSPPGSPASGAEAHPGGGTP